MFRESDVVAIAVGLTFYCCRGVAGQASPTLPVPSVDASSTWLACPVHDIGVKVTTLCAVSAGLLLASWTATARVHIPCTFRASIGIITAQQ